MAKTHFPLTGGNKWAAFLQQYQEDSTTGDVFYVNSATGNDSSGYGRSPDAPFASIGYAVMWATANNGDRIYVMPGHAEVIAAGSTLALSKAGIEIVGLGLGTNRPIITHNGTDSYISVTAANVALRNVILQAGIDEVVKAVSVTAANCTLDRVDVVEVASKQFVQFCLTNSSADDLTIQGCTAHQSTAPAADSLWIQLVGADRAKILNNRIQITTTNSGSSSVIESDTTAPANILIQGNVIVQLGGTSVVPINLMAGTSGFVVGNFVASTKTAIAGSIACGSCYAVENYAANVANVSGVLEPATAS